MPKNSIAEITYSSTTGATAAQFVPGGPSIIATAATFAATTTLVFEISINGGGYVTLSDVNGTTITTTVNGALADQYWHVNLPRGGCLIRANCTAGTMTSGNSWIAQASSDI